MAADGVASVRRGKAAGPHLERRLSARFVNTAPPGRHTDGGGLYLVVDPSGARRWLLRLVVRGRRRDFGLGSASLVSLADARDKAHELRCVARGGGDPKEEPAGDAPGSITFREAAAEFHRNHIRKGSTNGKHVDQWLTTLKTYAFPKIGNKLVYDVSRADVLAVLEPIC